MFAGEEKPTQGGEEKIDYTEYLAKMERVDDPKGGIPRINKIAALLTGVPILFILYHMLFPTPIEQNEWYQLEQQNRDRVRRAMEDAAAGRK